MEALNERTEQHCKIKAPREWCRRRWHGGWHSSACTCKHPIICTWLQCFLFLL